MNIATLVTILVLVGIALLLVLYPLWQQTRLQNTSPVDQSGQTLEEYQARDQAQLAAIKDAFCVKCGTVLIKGSME